MRLGGNINHAYRCNETLKQWLEDVALEESLGCFL